MQWNMALEKQKRKQFSHQLKFREIKVPQMDLLQFVRLSLPSNSINKWKNCRLQLIQCEKNGFTCDFMSIHRPALHRLRTSRYDDDY